MEHQDWLGSIIIHCLKNHPIDDFISGTTCLNLALDYDLHSLEAVSHSSLSQVINQVIYPFIYYFSYDESLFFILLLIFFLIYHLIHHAILDGNFWNISLTHWWAIAYRSQKCCLVIHDSLLYINRGCLWLRERTIIFTIISSSAFVSKVLSSTVLITASWFVITSHQGLNHFDYIIRVCLSYFIKLNSVKGLKC